MKTRNLLLAMALPTLFAACTAEEIVSQADSNVLEGRALLGDLSVKIESPVASRTSWSEKDLAWGEWEADDVFSGAVVDAARGTVSDYLLTNYIYKNADGSWETTSQMVEGIYSFYSYKGINTKNDRKPVAFDLTAQKADLDNPTKVIDDNQLFFSPLYDIEAKNTTSENTIALPLTFYPYHSIGAMKMTNETGQTLLITEIIANGEFAAKGAIMPTKIQAAGLNWSVRKNESVYKMQAKKTENGVATEEYSATEIEKMWQTSDLDNIGGEGELAVSNVLTMNCGNWEWADGKEVMAYMVIPAGSKIGSIDVRVVDEEGEAKLIKVKNTKDTFKNEDGKTYAYSIPSTGISSITFKRSVPVSVFGYTSGNLPKGIVAKENNLADASGYYIDTKEALIDLVNISRGDILVYNFGGLTVDAEIAEVIAEYTGGIVKFTNPIDIKDTEEVKISNIAFNAGVTVKGEDTATGFEGTTAIFEDATAKSLTIEAGATVTIKGGTYEEVVNKGTLSVEAQIVDKEAVEVEVAKITSEGALTIKGQNVKNVTLKKGSVSYEALDLDEDNDLSDETVYEVSMPEVSAPGWTINVGEGTKMTIERLPYNAVYNKTGSVVTTSTITSAGEINVTGNTFVWNLTNTGKVSGTGHVIICGTATNEGDLNSDYLDVLEDAVLRNYGDVINKKRTANKGTIKLYSDSYIKITNDNTVDRTNGYAVNNGDAYNVLGRIDNTEKGALEFEDDAATQKQEVYAVMNNATVEDIVALNTTRYHYNTLQFTGTLTLNKNFEQAENWDDATSSTNLANIKTFEFNGTTVDLKDAPRTGVGAGFTTARISGDVTMKGFTKTESLLSLGETPEVVLALGSSLTVKNMTVTTETGEIKVSAGFTAGDMTKAGKTVKSTVVDMTEAAITNGVVYGSGEEGVLYTVKK